MLRLLSRPVVRAASRVCAVRAIPRAAFHTRSAVAARVVEPEPAQEEKKVLSLPEARAELARNLQEDIDSMSPDNQWLSEYVAETKTTVKYDIHNQGVLAVRADDDMEVRITFRADDVAEPEMDEEDQRSEEDKQYDLVEVQFKIDVTNKQNGKIIRLECKNAKDGELIVQAITFPKQIAVDPTLSAANSTPASLAEAEPQSHGFDVNELSNEAVDAFLDYLEAAKIDDDLATFVAHQAQNVRNEKVQSLFTDFKAFL